ncbi:MAG TPA: hypothetical protein VK699_02695 [Terriglobales bacterium]|jgi:predicted O-methyltransferase YrrM|nr:hypothetical protein [Terriglobales bacterium]
MGEQQQTKNTAGLDGSEAGLAGFARRIVTTTKPRLAIENRSATGLTLSLAQGLHDNGFGKLITCDADAGRCAQLRKEIAAAGFSSSASIAVEVRNQFAQEGRLESNIDLLFTSTNHVQVVQHFLPNINPCGLILLLANESEYKQVREFALAMDKEGIISAVFLPETLKLIMAQKRSGRK